MTPSPSKLDLAARCAYPWTSGIRHDPFASSTAADLGTAVHAALAAAALGQPAPEVPADVDRDDYERAVRAGRLIMEADLAAGATVLLVERRVALDLRTGRGRLVQQLEQRRSGELRGDVDVAMRRSDGSIVVRDWKTGRPGVVSASDSMQIATYAVAIGSLYSCTSVVVQQVHLLDGYEGTIDSASYDAIDLGAALATIRHLASPPHGSMPQPGSHCRDLYCPIAARCPATLALVERAREACALPDTTTLDPPTAVRVLERLPLVDAYLDALRAEAERVIAAAGTVVADDGTAWGLVERDGDETIDAEAARAVLERLDMLDAVETKAVASKASIERAARRRATKRGELSPMVRAALEELRAAGAITRRPAYRRVGPLT